VIADKSNKYILNSVMMRITSTLASSISPRATALFAAIIVTVISSFSITGAAAKELDFRGPSGYLYDNCEGHCSYNWQCAEDLQCYKRNKELVPVPGCEGLGAVGVDYCHDPAAPVLVSEGQGDEEDEVEGEQEQEQDVVVGPVESIVAGTVEAGTDEEQDEAYDPIKAAQDGIIPDSTSVTYVGTNIPLKLGKCQGKCNSDSHCREGLTCLNLPGQTYVPGCEGELEDTGVSVCYDSKDAVDYDSIPEDSETLLFVGKRRGKDYTNQFGKCVGDCRVNADCRGDLECYEDGGSYVPGCLGVRVKGMDYCHDPNDRKSGNDLSYIALNPPYAIGHCEGSCNSDSDCFGPLVCYDNPNSEKVPGCSGQRLTGINYCVLPEDWAGYVPKPAMEDYNEEEGGKEEESAVHGGTTDHVIHDGLADDPPPSSNLQPKPTNPTDIADEPYKPGKISVSLPPIHVTMSFNSPERMRRLTIDRGLLISENIDEEGDLLAIIAGLLGEGIRRLGPNSYAGMLLDVAFVGEVEEEGTGTTAVTYEFSGSSIFRNNDDFVQPSPRLMEAAALDILDTEVIYDALTQSGNPVLQAVQSVSVTKAEEDAGEGQTKKKDAAEGSSSGVTTGIIVLVVVIILVCAGIGGILLYKRKSKTNFWKRPKATNQPTNTNKFESTSSASSNDNTPPNSIPIPSSPSKKGIIGSFQSPTRTVETDVAETPPTTPDVHAAMMPDINLRDDESSIGGDSNWSFTGRNFGYAASELDRRSIGSKDGKRRPIDVINAIVENGGEKCSSSVNSDSLNSAGMSSLGDVNVDTVLKLGENRARTWQSVDTMSSQFKDIWKQKDEEKSIDGILSLEPARPSQAGVTAEERV